VKGRKVFTIALVLALIFSQLFIPINLQAYEKTIYDWSVVGTSGFSEEDAVHTYLELDNDGVPYIIYKDTANDNKATVMKYNNSTSSWQRVGIIGFSDGAVLNPTIAFDSNNTLYAAYRDGGNGNGATVKTFNGSTWEDIGTPGFSEASIDYIKIAFYQDIPHVIYQDWGTANGKATIMQYSSKYNEWYTLGGVSVGFSNGYAYYTNIEIDDNFNVYAAYKDGSNDGNVTVKSYSYTSPWTNVGTPAFSDGEVNFVDLELYNGVPYVAFQDKANGWEITVMKYNGTSWEVVGQKGFTEDGEDYLSAEEVSLKIDSEGNIYVATLHDQYSDSFIVYKYTNSQWTEIGTYPVTTNYTYFVSLDIDSENNLYVGFSDGENFDRATVMKYSQPDEQTINSPYITGIEPVLGELPVKSIETSQYTGTITWSPNDSTFDYETVYTATINLTPKLGYKLDGITENFFEVIGAETTTNDANSGVVTAVFPITYANWKMVGESFTDEYTSVLGSEDDFYIETLDVAVDSQGIPYVAITYKINYGGVESRWVSAVKKYQNSGWVDLNSTSISDVSTQYINIEVDSDNYPVIAFYEHDYDMGTSKTLVKRWDGTLWENLGEISVEKAGDFGFKIYENTSYFAYANMEGSSLSVSKYNDAEGWITVGDNLSTYRAYEVKLDIDDIGNPYASYLEEDSPYKYIIQRYTGEGWETIKDCSGEEINIFYYNDIELNSTNKAYVAYRDPNNNSKATVETYNGSTWDILGTEGFTMGPTMKVDLEIDSNDKPLLSIDISSISAGQEGKYAYKYTSNKWIPLRSERFKADLNDVKLDTYQNKGYLVYSTYDGLWHGYLLEYTPTESYTPPTPSPRPSIPKLVIETDELPDGVEGQEYEYQLEGDGGREPYTWDAEGLPEGLEINEDGEITGVPEVAGTFNVKIELLDSRSYFRSKTLKLFIEEKEEEPVEVEEEFTDVRGHWFIDFLRDIFDRSIIFGYPDRTFRPNNKVTRGEFASMIIRTFDIDPIEGNLFDDTVDNWAESSINGAVGRGIITGYEDNTFRPNAPITREEMAAMIARALNLEEEVVEDYFEDIGTASSWAQLSIRRLGNSKIITGFPDGTFRPKDTLTRAEAVKVIYEILQDLDNLQ
jgi:hypothetical protein